MTEYEKLLRGEWYLTGIPELTRQHDAALDLCRIYNSLPASETEKRQEILRSLFGKLGERNLIEPVFMAAYGFHIFTGDDVFINCSCYFMDDAPITIGNHVRIGPQCGFYTAEHPADLEMRRKGYERALPITIEDDVWFGGGCTVLSGVTVGAGSIIGAGSVVTKDIPVFSMAYGNPCRVVRSIAPLQDDGD